MDRSLHETATTEARIGRALDEFTARRKNGEQISNDAFLDAHPDMADALRPMLGLLRELDDVRPSDQHRALAELLSDGSTHTGARRLGAFRVDGFLGRGGVGFVLDAFDERLDRRVALKVLRPELCATPAALARFHREARVAASLNHPNIVGIYDVGCERGLPYIAMEHVAGPTLAGLIVASGPLPSDLIRIIVGQLLDALDAAHRAGLIHRDVKPSNILIVPPDPAHSDDGARLHAKDPTCDDASRAAALLGNPSTWPRLRAKLADFGLARMRSSRTLVTADGSAIGTPEYMSPEQARGDAEIDARTDLYSVGVVIYELLTGKTPFRAGTMTGTLRLILESEPSDPCRAYPAADRALASLAMRLLSKRPEARLASAAEAADALRSRRRVKPPPATHHARTRWTQAAFAAVVVALLAWAMTRLLPYSSSASRGPTLTGVSLLETDGQPLELLATFDHSDTPQQLCRFARGVKSAEAKPQIVDVDGRGSRIIVVGIDGDPDGKCILGFSSTGALLWSTNPAPRNPVQWPDVVVTTYWTCRQLLIADVDNTPGDEIIVLARELAEYPCCIAVLDPSNGTIRTQFWHIGHLQSLAIVADYFADERPAVVTWGQNNKLDGWSSELNDRSHGDPPRTSHDIVTAFAILDPLAASGLGPPRTNLIDLPPAVPVAYAFVDIEMEDRVPFAITEFHPRFVRQPHDGKDPRLSFSVECGGDGSGTLVLDRNLEIDRTNPVSGSPCMALEFWNAHWRLVAQDGRYLDWDATFTPP